VPGELTGSDHHVDQLRRTHDHLADRRVADRTLHVGVGQGQRLQVGLGDVRGDLQAGLDLALDLAAFFLVLCLEMEAVEELFRPAWAAEAMASQCWRS